MPGGSSLTYDPITNTLDFVNPAGTLQRTQTITSEPRADIVQGSPFTEVASLGGLRGQIDRLGSPGLTGTALTSGLPSIDTVADDLVRGRGLGENINNPSSLRAGGGFDGEIGRTRDGFAIFDSMQSGVDAINKFIKYLRK